MITSTIDKEGMEMKKNTEKAVRLIPAEINRLARVVATIGESLIDRRIGQIKGSQRALKNVVPNRKSRKRGRK